MQAVKTSYISDADGNKTAVILSVNEYQRIMDDLHDLAVIAERKEEYPVSMEEIKARLRDNHSL